MRIFEFRNDNVLGLMSARMFIKTIPLIGSKATGHCHSPPHRPQLTARWCIPLRFHCFLKAGGGRLLMLVVRAAICRLVVGYCGL